MEQNDQPEGKSLIDRSITGMLWVTLDKLGGSVVNFLITVLLARLLFPDDFGLVAMAMVFFELCSVFVESGFSTALIREKSISELDKSTMFIFNMISALVLYALLFLCAPLIASFFEAPLLTMVVRVMGLTLVVDALSIVQTSALIHKVDFRTQALARFGAIIVSGGIGVLLAYQGFGVWALVARILVNGAVLAVLLWRIEPWKPTMAFSWVSFKRLFAFGSRILAAGLLDKFFTQANKLVIGKFFAAATLGFYAQAATFVNMAINTLFRPVQTVSYPVLAKLQDDLPGLKAAYRTILRLSSFIIFPVLVLLGVLSEPFISVLIGEKWLPAAPYLRLLCIASATIPISTVNLNVLLVLGRSDLGLRLEVIKKVNIAISIAIGLQFGIMGLVIAEAIVSCVNLLVNAYYSRMLLGYTPWEQVRDALPSLFLGGLMGVGVALLHNVLPLEGLPQLLVLAVGGGSFYILLHAVARTREWRLVTGTLLPRAWSMITGRDGSQMNRSMNDSAASSSRHALATDPPSVDVLMLAYNVQPYITDAVAGVLEQKAGFPIRLVIAEDASTDTTPRTCERLAAAHPRTLLYLPGEKNLGIAARTVEGLRHCNAKYVAICDSDDRWIDPEKLATQVEFLEAHPDHGLSYTDIRIMTRNGEVIEHDSFDTVRTDYAGGEIFAKLLQGNFINNSTAVVRRDLLLDLKPNACSDNLIGDYFRWLQVSMRCKVHFLARKTMDYRQGGITSTKDMQQRTWPRMRAAMGRLLLENDQFERELTAAEKAILFRKVGGTLWRTGTPLPVKAALLVLLFKYLPGSLRNRLNRLRKNASNEPSPLNTSQA